MKCVRCGEEITQITIEDRGYSTIIIWCEGCHKEVVEE